MPRQRQHDLRQQIDGLRNRLEASRSWIGLDDEHFRQALGASLDLIGADGLKQLCRPPTVAQTGLRFRTSTSERTRHGSTQWTPFVLRPRGEPVWEWRRESPIRPVVFEDPGVVSDDVVHLHLEHSVVRRLLGRFTAQGFVHHDLSAPVSLRPRIRSHASSCSAAFVYMVPEAVRLHEEVVPISARWIDPEDRKGSLAPYRRTAERDTLRLLEDALLDQHAADFGDGDAPAAESATRDVGDLLPHLKEQGAEVAADAAPRSGSPG